MICTHTASLGVTQCPWAGRETGSEVWGWAAHQVGQVRSLQSGKQRAVSTSHVEAVAWPSAYACPYGTSSLSASRVQMVKTCSCAVGEAQPCDSVTGEFRAGSPGPAAAHCTGPRPPLGRLPQLFCQLLTELSAL